MKTQQAKPNTMKYRPFQAIICFFLILSPGLSNLQAQTKPYSEEVTVVAPYVPNINDANKINFSPKAQDSVLPKPEFSYGIKSTLIPTIYAPDAIEPAKMAGEPIKKLYDNYLKGGYGNYNTPFLELYHNNSRSKDMNYGFSARHFSSAGKIAGYGFPGYSENDIQVFGRKSWDKKSTLNASLGFNRQVVHYYGYKEALFDTLPSKEDTKQRFALFSLNTGWKTAETDSSHLSHEIRFNAYYLYDLYKTKETSFSLNDKLGQSVKWFKFSPSQQWGLGSSFDFLSRKTDTLTSHNTWMLSLKPTFAASLGGLGVKIGLHAQVVNDTAAKLHLYPMAEVKGELVPGILSFFAGIDGGMKAYSYRDIITENPYSSTNISSSYANTTYRFYGGIRSRLFDFADLSVDISQSHIDDMPFFVNDSMEVYGNKFVMTYDKVDLLKIRAEIAYHLGDKIAISDALEWQSFTMAKQEKPWHVPALKNTFSFSYNIQDKIFLKFDFLYYGKMYAADHNGKVISLDARPDLNIGIEYQYSKLIGAFLNVNNIANQQYPLWNNYPAKGINVLAGLRFSF